MSVYRNLCKMRYEEIAKALTAKYTSAKTINEKIEILERIQEIELFLTGDFNDFIWKEAYAIEGLGGLTLS